MASDPRVLGGDVAIGNVDATVYAAADDHRLTRMNGHRVTNAALQRRDNQVACITGCHDTDYTAGAVLGDMLSAAFSPLRGTRRTC